MEVQSCPPCNQTAGHKEVPHDDANIDPISDCPHGDKSKSSKKERVDWCSPTGARIEPVPEPKKGDPKACYLPKEEDLLPSTGSTEMGPVGPWATGRVDWAPLAGMTGTRPVVDRYSITRYSMGEWRNHNAELLNKTSQDMQQSHLVAYNAKNTVSEVFANADKKAADNTKRMQARTQDIHRFKAELERAIEAASEEVELLEEQRRRLKGAASVLDIPESIASECLDRRTGRMEPDLVRDGVEEQLVKEVALICEIRDLFNRTLVDIEMQLAENKTAKARLEYDWSDKQMAFEIDSINSGLTIKSNIILYKPGATRFGVEQSTIEHWEHFTRETLCEGETVRQRSIALRGTLDAILVNASRDLRSQADKVDLELAERIACNDDLRMKMEGELREVLRRLASTETLIECLKDSLKRNDNLMKVAQTRLDNRLQRPRVENCRDPPAYGLIDEVKAITEGVAALTAQLNMAEGIKAALLVTRGSLEREIMIKMRTLFLDRERCQLIRSHYPSAAALSGH